MFRVDSINLQSTVIKNLDKILEKSIEKYSNKLSDYIACSADVFQNTNISIELNVSQKWIDTDYKAEASTNSDDSFLTIKKHKGSQTAEILLSKNSPPFFIIEDIIKNNLNKLCLRPTFPQVFIASAERTGASIFKNELNFNKNQLVNLLSKFDKSSSKSINPFDILNSFKRTYPQTVEHNVEYISYKIDSEIKKGNSKLILENPEISKLMQEIAGGTYKFHKDFGLYFIPKGSQIKLGLGEASSAVRSLMIIWFWLMYTAEPGDLLMIDEPELNLHPENQRKLAKLIALLIRAGIKVFITTHSDYITREFNTLIMLGRDEEHISEVRAKFEYTENEFLKSDEVSMSYTSTSLFKLPNSKRKIRLGTITKVDVGPTGFKMDIFDKTIIDMNKIQDSLIYGL